MKKILVADIGGTNSRFAAFELDAKGNLLLKSKHVLETVKAGSFEDLLCQLDVDAKITPKNSDMVVFAVPGPILNYDIIQMARVNWDIHIASVKSIVDRPFYFINDFVAQAYGCLTDETISKAIQIREGALVDNTDIMIVGAGTGLGASVIKLDNQGNYFPIQSEGGHTNFPFVNEKEFRFRDFLHKKLDGDYLDYDIVVSGQGLSLLYEYLEKESLSPKEVSEKIDSSSLTSKIFSKFYGRFCKNLCLSLSLRCKLFISGGVALKNPFLIDNDIFRDEFINIPKFKRKLQDIPVFLNTNESNGLWGAAYYASLKLGTEK